MKFGSAIHAGLPFAHLGSLDDAMSAFNEVWGDEVGDAKRNVSRARAMIREFIETHSGPRALYKQIAFNGKFGELKFELDVGLRRADFNDVPLLGYIDNLGQHIDTQKKWIIEYKTSAELSGRFMTAFGLNPQILVYSMAARMMGIEVEGGILEGLLTHKTKNDCLAFAIDVPERQDARTIEWVRYIFDQLISCEENENFPPDYSACSPYAQFGQMGFVCEFEPLCTVEDWTSLSCLYSQMPEREKKS